MKPAMGIAPGLDIQAMLELINLLQEDIVQIVRLGALGVLMEMIIILAIHAPLAIIW
jgi:hypothetical protein